MRVIYTDDRPNQNPDYKGPVCVFGEPYTVLREFDYMGVASYTLCEFGPNYGFSASRFTPISDTDEQVEIEAEHQHEAIIYAR